MVVGGADGAYGVVVGSRDPARLNVGLNSCVLKKKGINHHMLSKHHFMSNTPNI